MLTAEEVEKLEAVLGAGNFSSIARKSGLARQHVSRALRGLGGLSLDAAGRIASATSLSVSDVHRYIQHARNRPSKDS